MIAMEQILALNDPWEFDMLIDKLNQFKLTIFFTKNTGTLKKC